MLITINFQEWKTWILEIMVNVCVSQKEEISVKGCPNSRDMAIKDKILYLSETWSLNRGLSQEEGQWWFSLDCCCLIWG